jgi:hypothetical protein
MRSGKISDVAITASSTYSSGYKPSFGRLTRVGSSCSWSPTVAGRVGSCFQVDLGQLTTVTGIATQGTCYNLNEWAKSYSVSYGTEPNSWTPYKESGNVKVRQRAPAHQSCMGKFYKTHADSETIKARLHLAMHFLLRFLVRFSSDLMWTSILDELRIFWVGLYI